MDLADCRYQWLYDETYNCWCLEDILYTPVATTPKFQRLSIFVPKALLNADGRFPEEAKKVPVVFENNSAGYMQMPHVWLGGPRCYAKYHSAYAAVAEGAALAERVRLLNPLSFIGAEEKSVQAKHYLIRVGASNADTSLSVAMTLALKLQNAECGTVDYALVWDHPHSEADYPGDVLKWIDTICR